MEISEIKEQLDILTVLDKYGLKPNRNQHINCPFHADKTPSMKVYAETNTVYCFSGNCSCHGKSLDVIDFVMRQDRCSKHEAIMTCKGWLQVEEQPTTTAYQTCWEALRKAGVNNAKSKAYLKSRGLPTVGIGYHSGRIASRQYKEQAQAAGLVNWASNSIIYALQNAGGQVVSFYARGLEGGHYYQKGRTGLYPEYPSQKTTQVILTESIIDAHSLLQIKELKDYTILALFGTNGFTKEHEKALLACPKLEEVILMLDGDEAGQKASVKLADQLSNLLPMASIKIANLPYGTDVNELWSNHLSGELFVELITKSSLKNTPKVAVKQAILSSKEEKKPVETPTKNKLNTSQAYSLEYGGKYACYSVKGFSPVKHLDSLKITLVVSKEGKKYRGKVELYEDTAVQKYCKAAGLKLQVEPSYLDLDMSLLTDELEQYREQLEQQKEQPITAKIFGITPTQKKLAQGFLKQDDLFTRLNILIGKTGIVGEERTRLLLFIVASSYKCKNPLHALIQGASGTGKTLLLRKIMGLLPDKDCEIWTRISDKSLYHAGTKYRHKAIAVEDWDGLSEEVQYVIRELQSGQILRSSITEKQADGKMDSRVITTQGPIASLMCTTHGSVYEDNMSRCFLVAVDESVAQTSRILDYQYQKDRGEIDKEIEGNAIAELQNIVYTLQPKEVVNPYAGKLVLPPRVHKIRRLNDLFQTFVRQIAWLHQYQRQTDKKGRIIATKQDLELAIDLLFETILLKVDELDGSLRQFFEDLKGYVLEQGKDKNYCFGRREIRQALHLSKSQQHRYMQQLLDFEYIQTKGGFSNRGYQYQVMYWDDNKALRQEVKSYLQVQLKQL